MEKQKRSGKKIGYKILAIFLSLLFVLGTFATIYSNIRFSKLQYVENVAREAAQVTEDNTEYLSESRLERAWKVLRTTVKKPETYEDYELYASIAIAREDFENAVEYLKGCIQTCPGSSKELAVLHLRLGSLYILQEDKAQAMEELNEAQNLNPNLAPVYYLRGQLYAEGEETEKAFEDFRTYCTLDGRDPKVSATLASLFEEAGDFKTAVVCYTDGIETSGTETPYQYVDRARCEVQLEDIPAAIKDLEQYFTLTKEDPDGEVAAMYGACQMEMGELAKAAEFFHQAIDNGYAEPGLLYEQSLMCLYQLERYEEAAADGEKAIAEAEKTDAATADLYFWTGMAHMAQEQYKEALDRLTAAEKKDPGLDNIHYYLGVSAMAEEEYKEAEAFFATAIRNEEYTAASRYNRAICYIQMEEYESAVADLEIAARDTQDKELANEAAELLRELKEAIEQIKRAEQEEAELAAQELAEMAEQEQTEITEQEQAEMSEQE